jgi:hypothetical protein
VFAHGLGEQLEQVIEAGGVGDLPFRFAVGDALEHERRLGGMRREEQRAGIRPGREEQQRRVFVLWRFDAIRERRGLAVERRLRRLDLEAIAVAPRAPAAADGVDGLSVVTVERLERRARKGRQRGGRGIRALVRGARREQHERKESTEAHRDSCHGDAVARNR